MPPRERWLTRQEAAWLLRGARHLRVDGRHLVDFILHGLYTGSRKQTILTMHLNTPSTIGGYVDTESGVFYRKPKTKVGTKKQQNPARLPSKYLAHLQRQVRNGRRYVVEDYRGGRVGDIKKGWQRALSLAEELAAKKGIILDLIGCNAAHPEAHGHHLDASERCDDLGHGWLFFDLFGDDRKGLWPPQPPSPKDCGRSWKPQSLGPILDIIFDTGRRRWIDFYSRLTGRRVRPEVASNLKGRRRGECSDNPVMSQDHFSCDFTVQIRFSCDRIKIHGY